jgi:hypothetical protein
MTPCKRSHSIQNLTITELFIWTKLYFNVSELTLAEGEFSSIFLLDASASKSVSFCLKHCILFQMSGFSINEVKNYGRKTETLKLKRKLESFL